MQEQTRKITHEISDLAIVIIFVILAGVVLAAIIAYAHYEDRAKEKRSGVTPVFRMSSGLHKHS